MTDIDNFQPVKPSEIKLLIRNLKNKKSPGFDGIKNILLKHLPKKAVVFLTNIFNACLKIGYFPEKWKEAIICCIPKPQKDLTQLESYRPISLISSLGKIFEKCIKKRIDHFTELNNVLPDEQLGFRQRHSTEHQLYRIGQIIKTNFNNKTSTGLLALDIEKAFDTVWHDALIHKLVLLKFPTYLTKIIQNFLRQRKFAVKIGNTKSDWYSTLAGVPQGSALSPALYNIFTYDIPHPQNCEIALFADDTSILCNSNSPTAITLTLENAFITLKDYFHKWKIKINVSKTQAIFITRKRKACNLPSRNLNLADNQIEWKNTVKYLGLTLAENNL